MARILIAEDEARIASFLEKGLRANGFATAVVDDGLAAATAARDRTSTCSSWTWACPASTAWTCSASSGAGGERLPVVILTARDELDTTVAGFAGGADDYVTKPFRFEELLARIRVRLRSEATEETTLLRAGAITLDLRTRRASLGDRTPTSATARLPCRTERRGVMNEATVPPVDAPPPRADTCRRLLPAQA
jgi:two-component system, OmpR family, copper resistance phosphate regulon response regulator CusR